MGVTVAGYLRTSYSPDCEYLDGVVVERNVGEWEHSRPMTVLAVHLGGLEHALGIYVAIALRVQVSPTRFRVPDVCVLRGNPGEQILTSPPFLVIEILSPEDRMRDMQQRVNDYLEFGISNIWVIDPKTRTGHIYQASRTEFVKDGIFRTTDPDITINLAGVLD